MISEVVMPQMGADMKEGTILRWLKAEGDEVQRGEVIAEIETDKANVEIEAFEGGTFRKVLRPEGETVPVGTVIAVIAAPEDDLSAYDGGSAAPPAQAAPPSQAASGAEEPSPPHSQAPTAADAGPPPEPETPESQAAQASPREAEAATAERQRSAPDAPSDGATRQRVSPVARRIAEQTGVDLSQVRGTGPDGRILRRDVEAAQAAPQAPAPPREQPAPETPPEPAAAPRPAARPYAPGEDIVEDVPLSRMRRTIAQRMQQSKQQVPHYYLTTEVDMTEAMRFLDQANASVREQGLITVNHYFVFVTARALVRHPNLNAWWLEDHLQTHSRVNVGIAIPLEDGLVVPAVLDCGAKSLREVALDARDLVERARAGRLRPEEYSAATFSISNLGTPAFGIESVAAIINPPQVAILGAGTVKDTPVVRNGEIVVRSVTKLILSADHRATDGAYGAQFLKTLREMLETPALILV